MNMRKIFFGIVLSVLIMTSCSLNNITNSVQPQQGSASNHNPTDPSVSSENPVQTVINDGNEPTTVTQGALDNLSFDNIKGKIRNIIYTDNNKILIWANNLYLFDIETGNISAESAIEDFSTLSIWTIANGYVAVGLKREAAAGNGFVQTDEEASYSCIFYDKNLNKVSDFDFTSLLNEDEYLYVYDMVSFSNDGSNVVFATDTGLYSYDFKKKEKNTIIDLKSENAQVHSGIIAFQKIDFTNNDKSIAFWANSFDVPAVIGSNGFSTIGIVNADGSGLSNIKIDSYMPQALIVRDKFALLYEDDSNTTGKVQYMETTEGTITAYDLRDKKESAYICASQDGSYFASAVPGKIPTEWIISIYNSDTGKFETEITVSGSEQSLYMALNPRIMIFDDIRVCVVALGINQGEVKSKVVSFNF